MRAVVLPSELLKPRLDRFTRALRGLDKGDVRALHRARVASRRLRELVPVLQLPPDAARKLGRRLRKVTVRLGKIRELDVMLELTDELRASYPRHDSALRRIRSAVVQEREAARDRLTHRLPIEDLRRIVNKLERARHDLRDDEATRTAVRTPSRSTVTGWAADARTTQRAARLSSAIAEAGAVYLPERLHDVRVAAKKLRYILELSAELTGDKSAARSGALRTLRNTQDLLGRMHDVEMLIARVRDLQASPAPPSVTAWRELDALVVTLEDLCRRYHARYVRARGKLDAIAAKHAAAPVPLNNRARRAG